MSSLPDPLKMSTRSLIQRWIGAKDTGNLNKPSTVAELLSEGLGIGDYLKKTRQHLDHSSLYARKFIQRWVGAPLSGDLNDGATVAELLKDISGLRVYLIEKAGAETPAPVTAPDPPKDKGSQNEAKKTYLDYTHNTPNKGGKIKPLGIVFHHSAGSFQGSLSWIQQARAGVSYHMLIHPDGSRHRVVDWTRRAWHAGKSNFRGKAGCNNFMIGIAYSGSTYSRQLTEDEILSTIEICRDLVNRFEIEHDWLTDHRTVSPNRKDDLKESEWLRLRGRLIRALYPDLAQ